MNKIRKQNTGFLIIWEFRVRRGQSRRFEEVYGPNGVWAKFFRIGKGYIRSELLCDPETPQRYCTLDLWASRRAYESFRRRNIKEYKRIDQECEALTTGEKLIGYFHLAKRS